MIDQLTLEQKHILKNTCTDWIESISNTKQINKADFEKGIYWIYNDLLKLATPKIVYCDSWSSAYLALNLITSHFRGLAGGGEIPILRNVDEEIQTAIHQSVRNIVRNVTTKLTSDRVRSSARNSIFNSLGGKLNSSIADFDLITDPEKGWDAIYSGSASYRTSSIAPEQFKYSFKESVRASTFRLHDSFPWGGITDRIVDAIDERQNWETFGMRTLKSNFTLSQYKSLNFCAYYDFFQRIGVINHHGFNLYKSFIKSGAFMVIELDGIVIAVQPPLEVHQNEQGQLHNSTKSAVRFRDSTEHHFINGREMPRRIFIHPFTKADLINEGNEDVKAGMMSVITERDGQQGLLDFLGAKVVDEKVITHFEGYTEVVSLYKTHETYSFLQDRHGNKDQPYCWSGFKCPSTGTDYLIDNSADFTCAMEAMKFLRPTFVPEQLTYQWKHSAN
jgi:hypothetical protein